MIQTLGRLFLFYRFHQQLNHKLKYPDIYFIFIVIYIYSLQHNLTKF